MKPRSSTLQTLAQRETALLDGTDYQTSTVYDALNRPKSVEYPQDGDAERKKLIPTYNRAGALQSVDLDDGSSTVTYVDRIAYNARGQRLFVALGNGVFTRYAYDPDTFRLRRMRSREYTKTGTTYSETGTRFQDSGYHYDLSGNILSVLDRSDIGTEVGTTVPPLDGYPYGTPPTTNTFFREYTYDPLSRLLAATGAVHDQRSVPDPWSDLNQKVQDLTSIRGFTEEYAYDANSNLTQTKHLWGATTKYNRQYTTVTGTNRIDELENTTASTTYSYQHDAVGNITQENTARKMTWDHADRMHTWRNQVSGSEASVYAQYLYDAAGQRVMKVVSKSGTDDVVGIYVDGIFEHREHRTGGGTTSNDEIHVTAGEGRLARLRVGTAFSSDNSPATIYVLGDHLGSSSFTLQSDGTFFSREEYTPFGESSYGSYDKKRYRFTGKEKDEESGLNYHSARYYAPWMARWTSADPAGMVDGPNVFAYARGNPIGGKDPKGTQTGEVASTGAERAVADASNTSEKTSEAQVSDVGEMVGKSQADLPNNITVPKHVEESLFEQFDLSREESASKLGSTDFVDPEDTRERTEIAGEIRTHKLPSGKSYTMTHGLPPSATRIVVGDRATKAPTPKQVREMHAKVGLEGETEAAFHTHPKGGGSDPSGQDLFWAEHDEPTASIIVGEDEATLIVPTAESAKARETLTNQVENWLRDPQGAGPILGQPVEKALPGAVQHRLIAEFQSARAAGSPTPGADVAKTQGFAVYRLSRGGRSFERVR